MIHIKSAVENTSENLLNLSNYLSPRLKDFKHLTRWYNTISKREAVVKGYDLLKRDEKIPKP